VLTPDAGADVASRIVDQRTFSTAVLAASRERPVIVEVYADWCQFCRRQRPRLEALSREFSGRIDLVRLDADRSEALAKQLRVKGLPTLIAYRHGMALTRIDGLASKAALRALFQEYSRP